MPFVRWQGQRFDPRVDGFHFGNRWIPSSEERDALANGFLDNMPAGASILAVLGVYQPAILDPIVLGTILAAFAGLKA